jgi:hypothetical protein
MTPEQEEQMRAILDIEGFSAQAIATLFERLRHDPVETAKWVYWIGQWRFFRPRDLQ